MGPEATNNKSSKQIKGLNIIKEIKQCSMIVILLFESFIYVLNMVTN